MIRLAKAMGAKQTGIDEMDPAEFAREVRRLAIDAYKALTNPDFPEDGLTRLKHRSHALLCQTRVPRAIEMTRWLCSVNRAIDARLGYEGKVATSKRRTDVAETQSSCGRSAYPRIHLVTIPERDVRMPARTIRG